MTSTALRRGERVLAPVHPNVGIEADYRRRLDRMIEAMNRSLLRWLAAQWRRNPPVAQDELPITGLRRQMRDLRRQWQSKFDDTSRRLADHFAQEATSRASASLERILREGGMTVNFRMGRAAQDIVGAAVGENVRLIRSIAEGHLSDVEGIVMRSVQEGRDLGYAARRIEEQFDVSKKRAALIARDQNNKSTAAITRARQEEIGIHKAKWLHSGAGKHPRVSHVAYSQGRLGGPYYEVSRGALIDGERIWPGQLINCRCVSQPVVEGFS